MRQLTIHIPDGKFQFILNLLRSSNCLKIEMPAAVDTYAISEEQKTLVTEELSKIKSEPNYLLDWNEMKYEFHAELPLSVLR